MSAPVVDLFLVYQFLKRLSTPFEQWEACKLGIIDKNGKVLRPADTLTTRKEKEAWGYFDRLVANLKKLLAKVPGGSTRIASYAAAILLLREQSNLDKLSDEELTTLLEQEVANVVGSGNIAGVGVGPKGEPPGITALMNKKMLKRKNLETK